MGWGKYWVRKMIKNRYSIQKSKIHSLDPRIKISFVLVFIFVIVLTPAQMINVFFFYIALVLSIILLSKIPFTYLFKRALVVLPFIFLVIISISFMKGGNLLVLWNVVIKSVLSVLLMILLTSTTPFQKLLNGLNDLKMPKIMVLIISFMYRYIFITVDEVNRMKRARDSRAVRLNRRNDFITAGNIIGSLFIRSYERGERIYQAMLARGFDDG